MDVEVVTYQEEGEPDMLDSFLDSLSDRNDKIKVRKLIRFLQTQGRDLGAPVFKAPRRRTPRTPRSFAWLSPLLHVLQRSDRGSSHWRCRRRSISADS